LLEIRKGGEISILTKSGRVPAAARAAETMKNGPGWF
jgi:hypothetical protein